MSDHSKHVADTESASPWPVLVAVGLVLSEVGVFVNLLPIAIGGLALFAWSIGGILHDSGYVSTPWPSMAALGVTFVLLGGVVYGLGTGFVPAGSATGELIGLSSRGLSITAAGILTLAVALIGQHRTER